ncbi:hypothetical protein BGX24_004385 [Mortierella sp. AD032]|nr:hypothetical protein BGX24_004385 [Mortierella sp. AD032]
MFAGFSAWFAPELRSYKQTWDSVRGQKRLSLKRYKSVFPALTRFDSREHSKMAVGMDAYNSTNVISLDNSWQLHQPEPGMHDLSVTPSSGGASYKPSATKASIADTRTSSPFRRSLSVSATSTSKRRSFTPTPGSAPRSATPTPGSAPRSIAGMPGSTPGSITTMPGSAPRSITATPRSVPPSATATPGSAPHSVSGTPGDGPRPFIATPGRVRTITLSKSDSEKANDEDDDKSDEDEESNDIAEVGGREEEAAVASPGISWLPSRSDSESLKQGTMSENSMEGIEILVESASPATGSCLVEAIPQTTTTKKRRLPTSLLRSKREPARTHDSQVSEDFFASSYLRFKQSKEESIFAEERRQGGHRAAFTPR